MAQAVHCWAVPSAPSRSPAASQARRPFAVSFRWVLRSCDPRLDEFAGRGAGGRRAACGRRAVRRPAPRSLCALPTVYCPFRLHGVPQTVPHIAASCRARARVTASAGAGAAGGASGRSAWVERCLQRAQQTAILVDGVPFMPLAEVRGDAQIVDCRKWWRLDGLDSSGGYIAADICRCWLG